MGHAGAIISGGKGDAKSKILCLEANNIKVVINPAEIGDTMKSLIE